MVGIGVLAFDVARRLEEGATASADAVQWTLNQTDVELLALDVAVLDAIRSPRETQLAEVRKRFDVFFSRVTTLGEGALFIHLRSDAEFMAAYRKLTDFIAECTPLLDRPDTDLATRLPLLHSKLADLRPSTRNLALAGLRAFAEQSEANRKGVERTLILVAMLTVVFILTLLGMVAVLLRLDAVNWARTVEVESGAARLAAIVATAQDAVITLDAEGAILTVNAAAERLFGRDRQRLIGADPAILFPEDQHPALAQALAQALSAPDAQPATPTRHRLNACAGEGRTFPVEATVSATAAIAGARLRVIFLRDLTAAVAAEAALVEARDEALEGERAKARLLAVMSHEVRTPLNGLLGTLDLLGSTPLTPEQRNYLRILDTSGRLLLHHVNDVLDISRLDSGQMRVTTGRVDLGTLAREVLENQGAAARAAGNRLVLALPPDGRLEVMSEGRMLKQVLLNLLDNAVKFTEGGTITLAIRHLGPEGPTEFSVSDTGIGIAPEHIARIFEDFVTLDASYARKQGGTGLGLGIARRIVAQLGGALAAESAPGQGTTFRFALRLPILAPGAALPAQVDRSAKPGPWTGPGLDLLVIEDNEINREVLRDMLGRAGHRVTEAPDGAEGLRRAAERRFDAILMDISMPRMDGLQAMEVLRALDGPNRTTPVLAMTAHALPDERARFLAAGMAVVLTKPFTSRELAEALDRCRPAPPVPPAGQPPSAPPAPRARRPRVPAPVAHLVPKFLADSAESLTEIQALAALPDEGETLQRAVHRWAGSAGLMGATALARDLGRIETALKAGDLTRARQGIAALPASWQAVRDALEAQDSAAAGR